MFGPASDMCNNTMEDTLQLAILARGDQVFKTRNGKKQERYVRVHEELQRKLCYHETECSFGGEADLHRLLVDCDKNPGHENFIPVNEFSLEHLPEGYRDPDIVKYIRAQADLTVRITSKFTSMHRPKGYSFYNYRGKNFVRVGSGFMQYVYRNERRSNKPCPCQECKNSPTPRLEWSRLKIRTATHVVFDDDEAENTTVEFFYDDDKQKDKVKRVYGECVAHGNVRGDWCDIRCVSHDIELCNFLKETWGRWRWLETKVNQKYTSDQDHRLAILVSHPHGCSKEVSIGVWRHRDIIERSRDWENCVYTYDTPTCPGSSGAPVWILGRMKWAGFFGRHPHSGRPWQGLNISAIGWDKRSNTMN